MRDRFGRRRNVLDSQTVVFKSGGERDSNSAHIQAQSVIYWRPTQSRPVEFPEIPEFDTKFGISYPSRRANI
jgi:hypothetical protein